MARKDKWQVYGEYGAQSNDLDRYRVEWLCDGEFEEYYNGTHAAQARAAFNNCINEIRINAKFRQEEVTVFLFKNLSLIDHKTYKGEKS